MFKSKSVDAVLTTFNKAMEGLLEIVNTNHKRLDDIAIKQKELQDEKVEIVSENIRAENVLKKIKEMVGGDVL